MAEDDYRWNVSTIAKAAGLHRDTVRKRLAEAGVVPNGKKGNAPVYVLADAMQALFATTVISGKTLDPDKLDPKDRLDWYRSESERVKFAQTVRELVPSDEVRDEQADILKVVVGFLDSLPDRMERLKLFTPIQLESLEAACDGCRDGLYQALLEIED